jgi:hypothetical protein
MPKGGPRPGAGRPRGSRGRRTKDSITKADALGPTPLEVLLESMHAARAEGERAEAVECAKAAAPYVHPKLAATAAPAAVSRQLEMDYASLSEEELAQLEGLLTKVFKLPASEPPGPVQSDKPHRRGLYARPLTAGSC